MPTMPRRVTLCPRCLYVDAEVQGGLARLVVRAAVGMLLAVIAAMWLGQGADYAVDQLVRSWMVWAPLVVLAFVLPGPRVVCSRCESRHRRKRHRDSEQ